MFLLGNFLIRLKVVFFITISMLNGMPEGGGGRGEGGGVCTCSWWGKREYPIESSNLCRRNSHPVQL